MKKEKGVLMDSMKFREEIDAKVKAKIKELRKAGVVAMSVENLWQCVSLSDEYGPRGPNAAFHAKEIFAARVNEKFGKFLI